MLNIELKDHIEAAFDTTQVTSVTLCRDALELGLANGVELTLRIVGGSEYAMSWRWGEAEMRIDTAPLHDTLRTYPNHLHTPGGLAVDDPVSEIGADPWRNVRALIERLLDAPLLGHEPSFAQASPDARTDAS
jgi:hypothetical protein